ncbi:hypothetical protein Tco_1325812, partial [Tanacetum coccineum]
ILIEDPYEEAARQALEQAPHSPEYVPDPMELEDHAPVYVPEPKYPEYLAPSDDDIPMEDQPLPVDASPIALSPGYVADSDPEEDEEDPADYPADGGDDNDDESSDDDDKDDKDVEEEEEHLAPADSTDVAYLAVDLVPSAEETKPFETDKSAATPPPPPAYHVIARMSIRSQTPILFPSEEEVARLLALPTPPPSPLTPLSSPLPQIPSPPTSLIYAQAPLDESCNTIHLSFTASSRDTTIITYTITPSTSRRANIFEVGMPFWKRLLLTAPTPRMEVGESSAARAARRLGSTMARTVNYSFVDTMDASIRSADRRTMAAIEVVNLREDRAAVRADIRVLRRERLAYEQESSETCQALARYEAHNRALEARIAVLETQAHRHMWQLQDANNRATRHIMRIQALEAGARVDTLEDISSSS